MTDLKYPIGRFKLEGAPTDETFGERWTKLRKPRRSFELP